MQTPIEFERFVAAAPARVFSTNYAARYYFGLRVFTTGTAHTRVLYGVYDFSFVRRRVERATRKSFFFLFINLRSFTEFKTAANVVFEIESRSQLDGDGWRLPGGHLRSVINASPAEHNSHVWRGR